MDNAEKLAAYNMFISCLFDLDEPSLRQRKKEKKPQHNMCWMPLCTNKHK